MIDVKNGRPSPWVVEEKLSQIMASPFIEDVWYWVNVLEKVVFEEMRMDNLEACLIGTFGY